ncbi:MAG: phosphatidylserine decarboxylase [Halofilum sp. (in: g-proteobacteria)]|nr:phosphatidylserine decarboxylase [Halofilum sp. (in: g-proteobacteria)]
MRLVTLFRLPFAIAVLVALGAAVGGYWWLVALGALVAVVLFVFGRDPDRVIEAHPLGIVSPVDGWVTGIDTEHDPFLDREAVVARIRQGPLAPTALRSPAEGRVVNMWGGPDMPGRDQGYRMAVHLHTDEGDDIVFAVGRSPLVPGPLDWWVQPGERVGQGQRRGLAGWGRPVAVYVPGDSTAALQSGARVEAGKRVVCELVHAT